MRGFIGDLILVLILLAIVSLVVLTTHGFLR